MTSGTASFSDWWANPRPSQARNTSWMTAMDVCAITYLMEKLGAVEERFCHGAHPRMLRERGDAWTCESKEHGLRFADSKKTESVEGISKTSDALHVLLRYDSSSTTPAQVTPKAASKPALEARPRPASGGPYVP